MFSFEWFQKNQPVSITGAIVHSLSWPFASFDDVHYPNPHFQPPENFPTGVAIYCVHGTADRSSSFQRIAQRSLDTLPYAVSGIHLVSFSNRLQGQGIEEFSRELCNKIIANKDKYVILLGHSRGGHVIAHMAEYLAKEAGIEVLAVIPICTPFGGAEMAIWPLTLLSKSVKQMEINSEFLKDLTDKMRQSEIKYHPVAAERDMLVPVSSACIPEHRNILLVLDRHGHLSIMTSHRLVAHLHTCFEQACARLLGDKHIAFPVPAVERSQSDRNSDSPDTAPLDQACRDLDVQITKLKQQYAIRSSDAKILVLARLRELLSQMREHGRGEIYPQAMTISDFILAYLLDDRLGGIKPMDVIREQLNYPLSLFSGAKPDTQVFLEGLMDKYQGDMLPEKAEIQPSV